MNVTNSNSIIHEQNNYEINQQHLSEIHSLLEKIEKKLDSDVSISSEQRSVAQEAIKNIQQLPTKENALKFFETLKDIRGISEFVFKIVGFFV